eukprot:gene3788-4713_t
MTNKNKKATPTKNDDKTNKNITSTSTSTPTNENKKRKQPEVKDKDTTKTNNKENKDTKIDTKTIKTTESKPTTTKTETPSKQQPNKKQKKENSAQQSTTPKTEEKKSTPTTTTTTPDSKKTNTKNKKDGESSKSTTTSTITESKPATSGLSIFQSLKLNSKAESATTEESTSSSNSNNEENLLKNAFSTSNTYKEPEIEKVNQVIESVIGEKEKEAQTKKLKIERKVETRKIRDEQDPRTVFVANINLENANFKSLSDVFKQYGTIQSIRFRSLPIAGEKANRKETFVTKNYHDSRTTCNGYVVFSKESEAKKALVENGKVHFGKHLRVDIASHKFDKKEDDNTVFIGNVPYEVEEEEIHLLFEKSFGDVLSVRLIRDTYTNFSKGFGYVTFKDPSSKLDAIKQKEITFGNRNIRIFPTKENPKKGKTEKEKNKKEARAKKQQLKNQKKPKIEDSDEEVEEENENDDDEEDEE